LGGQPWIGPYLVSPAFNTIKQTVYNALFSMLARVGRFDPQQLLHLSLSNGSTLCIPYFTLAAASPLTSLHLICDVVIMAVARGFAAGCPSCHQPNQMIAVVMGPKVLLK